MALPAILSAIGRAGASATKQGALSVGSLAKSATMSLAKKAPGFIMDATGASRVPILNTAYRGASGAIESAWEKRKASKVESGSSDSEKAKAGDQGSEVRAKLEENEKQNKENLEKAHREATESRNDEQLSTLKVIQKDIAEIKDGLGAQGEAEEKEGLLSKLGSMLSGVWAAGVGLLTGKFSGAFRGMLAGITTKISTAFKGMFERATGVFTSLSKNLSGVMDSIKGRATSILSAGKGLIAGAASSAKNLTSSVLEKGRSVANAAKGVASSVLEKGRGALSSAGAIVRQQGVKGAAKTLGKKIPGAGLVIGAGLGVARAVEGDWGGAGLELASGAASLVPGAGTAASVALDAYSIKRDYDRAVAAGEITQEEADQAMAAESQIEATGTQPLAAAPAPDSAGTVALASGAGTAASVASLPSTSAPSTIGSAIRNIPGVGAAYGLAEGATSFLRGNIRSPEVANSVPTRQRDEVVEFVASITRDLNRMLEVMTDDKQGIFIRKVDDVFNRGTDDGGSYFTSQDWRRSAPVAPVESSITRPANSKSEHRVQRWTAPSGSSITQGTGGDYGPLLDMIASGESDYTQNGELVKGYDVVWNGTRHQPPKPLTEMTFAEVKEWQRETLNEQKARGVDPSKRSSAAGRYQFISSTLKSTQEAAGIADDELFSPENQDKLALALLNSDKKRGLDAFLSGNATADQLQDWIASQWASIKDSRGRGQYDSSINRSRDKTAEYRSALDQVVANLGSGLPSGQMTAAVANGANLTAAETTALAAAASAQAEPLNIVARHEKSSSSRPVVVQTPAAPAPTPTSGLLTRTGGGGGPPNVVLTTRNADGPIRAYSNGLMRGSV